LPKKYTPPSKKTVSHISAEESNGFPIFTFEPHKWYFLQFEHDRPFISRPNINAIVNGKQVVTTASVDYPKFDKNSQLTSAFVCKHFVGQLSTFMLFEEHINNAKKFVQMGNSYKHGLHSNQILRQLEAEMFDSKFVDKLLLLYSPVRVNSKLICN